MLIRREDKTIIFYIALLGAVLSVFIAGSLPARFREKAENRKLQRDNSLLQAGAIDKLKQASNLTVQLNGSEIDVIESVTRQLAAAAPQEKVQAAPVSFCASLSGWKVMVLSIGAGVIGYGVFWITMWSGIMTLYAIIRGIYFIIGKVSPNCAAARKFPIVKEGRVTFERNPDRILPLIIKLTVLLVLTLSLIVVIAWQMTSNHL